LPAQVIVEQGQVLDGALLLPAVSHTIDTQPGDTGVFLFQCDVQVMHAISVESDSTVCGAMTSFTNVVSAVCPGFWLAPIPYPELGHVMYIAALGLLRYIVCLLGFAVHGAYTRVDLGLTVTDPCLSEYPTRT
jgi:hypothetical protein